MDCRRAFIPVLVPLGGVRFRGAGGERFVGELGGTPALLARRCWPGVARQTLALGFEGPGIWGGLRREPAGNRGLGATGSGYAGVGMEEGSRGRAGLEDPAGAGA